MTELRFVYDCETMEKVLQYREVIDGRVVSQWKDVPVVFSLITNSETDVQENIEV